jgi:hypothetical protein
MTALTRIVPACSARSRRDGRLQGAGARLLARYDAPSSSFEQMSRPCARLDPARILFRDFLLT